MLSRPCEFLPRHAAVVILAVFVVVAPGAVHATTATSGCAGSPAATEANGFVTLSGSEFGDADGCYAMVFDNAAVARTCETACAAGGTTCTPSAPNAVYQDCRAALDWYLSSSAKLTAIPSSPGSGTQTYCTVSAHDRDGVYTRYDSSLGMPWNNYFECDSEIMPEGGSESVVVACRCSLPDTIAPTVSNTNAVQATASSVTVAGDVDEAATVYCNVAASGASHNATNVKAAGFSDAVGAAGSFSVTVTGVSGDGTKSVACVGEDGSSNLGSTSAGADFQFDGTAPTLTSMAGSHSGTTATITGSTSEASTVYCLVDTSGATVSASTVTSSGQSTAAGTAGSFTVTVTVGSVDGKSAYCVGEDGVGNLGATTSGSFGNAPTDISLSSATIAENSAVGTEVGTLTTTDVDAGDSFTYSITAQDVSAAFQIAGDKLQVGSGTVDFEATPTLSVTVRTTDSGGLSFDKALTVTVTGVNEAPTDVGLSSATIAENSAVGTEVGTLTTTDVDAGDSFTYSITTQDVSAALQIAGDKLQVGSGTVDFEATPTLSVTVRATDSGGLTFDKALTVMVTGVNEAPTDITFSAPTVESKAEPGAVVGTLSTIDVDVGDTFTYSITTAPSGVFYTSGNQVRVGPAFEDLSPGQLVGINATTMDSGGLTYTRAVSTEVVRAKNAILAALGVTVGVLSVAAAIVAVFYVKFTASTGAAAGVGSTV